MIGFSLDDKHNTAIQLPGIYFNETPSRRKRQKTKVIRRTPVTFTTPEQVKAQRRLTQSRVVQSITQPLGQDP